VEKRINYWNYLRKAIQIVDLQNGIIENQNQKLTVKLEEKVNIPFNPLLINLEPIIPHRKGKNRQTI